MNGNGESAPARSRVLIIGLDGLTFQLIDPWIAEGKLPVLARLIQGGVRARLRSTVQAESATAWASMTTGLNSGKHGVYAFVRRDPNDGRLQVINATDVQGERIWDVAGRNGRQVVVLNVPVTYPPTPVQGALVTGMLTPDLNRTFTWPPALGQELLAQVPGYRISVERSAYPADERGDVAFVRDVVDSVEQRLEAALYLLQGQPWDLSFLVFTAPDRVQHYYWAAMDPRHPGHHRASPAVAGAIQEIYVRLDRAVGQILEAAGEGVNAMIVSDHGFTGWGKYLYLNNWLLTQGLLSLQSGTHRQRGGVYRRLRRVSILRRLKSMATRRWPQWIDGLMDRYRPTEKDFIQWSQIDWTATRAYVDADRGLRINLKGREPGGIVEPGIEYETLRDLLIEQLLVMVDPHTGRPVIERVYRREELYNGPYLETAPDLVVEPARDRPDYMANYAEHGLNPAGTGEFLVPAAELSGNHTRHGIFVAHGPAFLAGADLGEVDITDIAPTALCLLGVPLPQVLDGQVLQGALTAEFVAQNPVIREEDSSSDRGSAPIPVEAFTDEELSALTEQLRGLGYLG